MPDRRDAPRWMWICLAGVMVLGGWLRFYRLESVPPGFFRDEADKGYSAYSLMLTGKDLDGRWWPLAIRSLRVYTSPIYQWAAIPPIALAGLTEWATRLPAATVGTLTIFTTFLLARKLLGRWGGILAALFLAVSPWHLMFSRWANQGIFVPLFLSFGLYAYLNAGGLGEQGKSRGRVLWALAAGCSLFGALFAYAPERVFVPLLLILLGILSIPASRERKGRVHLLALGTVLLLAVPLAVYFALNWGRVGQRFGAVSIFQEGVSTGSAMLQFTNNYLAHLSPDFVFFSGDANPRHSVPCWGMLYGIEIWTVGLGLLAVAVRRRRGQVLLIGWILLALVPASLTREGIPHALRSIQVLPATSILSALGLVYAVNLLKPTVKRLWALLVPAAFGLCLAVSALAFTLSLLTVYPTRSYLSWQYGYREAVFALNQLKCAKERVVVTTLAEYPEVLFLFYTAFPPATYQAVQRIPGVTFLRRDPGSPRGAMSGPFLGLFRPREGIPGEVLAEVRAPDGGPVLWQIIRK